MQMFGDRNEHEERQASDLQYSSASILDHNNMFNSYNDERHMYYPFVTSDLEFSSPLISLEANGIQNRNSMELLFDSPCAMYSRKNSLVLPCTSTPLFNYDGCIAPVGSNDPAICFSTFENNSEVCFSAFSNPQVPQVPQSLPENDCSYPVAVDNDQCEVSAFNHIQTLPSINLPLPDFLCDPNESNELTEVAESSEMTRGNEAGVDLLNYSNGSNNLNNLNNLNETIESTESTELTELTELTDSSEVIESPTLRRHAWTKDECQRLTKAVSMFGSSGHWREVAKYVGSRSEGQCINKWKNDLCKTKKRWNKQATKQLLIHLRNGLDREEIFQKMSDYTYIQVYQQIQKHNTNQLPWEEWEIKKLIELKKRGEKEAAIGRLLNNRHRDAVRNMWNKVKSNQF